MNKYGIPSPCFQCIKRRPNCHNSSCQEWVEFNQKLEEKRKEQNDKSKIEYQLNSIYVKRFDRTTKR